MGAEWSCAGGGAGPHPIESVHSANPVVPPPVSVNPVVRVIALRVRCDDRADSSRSPSWASSMPRPVERRCERRPGIVARRARPRRQRTPRAPVQRARSGTPGSRSGTAMSAAAPAPGRTGHGPSRCAAASPAPDPRPHGTGRASGSRTPPTRPGATRSPSAHHAAGRFWSRARAEAPAGAGGASPGCAHPGAGSRVRLVPAMAAARRRASASGVSRRGSNTVALIAATTLPEGPRTGAATQNRPGTHSSWS